MRKYAISTLSLLPGAIGPGGLRRSLRAARSEGLGLYALPLWGIEFLAPRGGYEDIIGIERAWNSRSGKFLLACQRLFTGDDNLPSLIDFLLFGPGHSARFEWLKTMAFTAMEVGHFPRESSLLEFKGRLPKKISESYSLINYLEVQKINLVVDTYHIRAAEEDVSPIWAVSRLAYARKVGMVHFQPFRQTNELDKFMSGDPTVIEKILKALIPAGKVPVVMELSPFDFVGKYSLSEIKSRIAEVMD